MLLVNFAQFMHMFLKLLIEHEAIVPDPTDPLREILRDLGPALSVEAFLGSGCIVYIHTYTCM